jgi:hypothetical protein
MKVSGQVLEPNSTRVTKCREQKIQAGFLALCP